MPNTDLGELLQATAEGWAPRSVGVPPVELRSRSSRQRRQVLAVIAAVMVVALSVGGWRLLSTRQGVQEVPAGTQWSTAQWGHVYWQVPPSWYVSAPPPPGLPSCLTRGACPGKYSPMTTPGPYLATTDLRPDCRGAAASACSLPQAFGQIQDGVLVQVSYRSFDPEGTDPGSTSGQQQCLNGMTGTRFYASQTPADASPTDPRLDHALPAPRVVVEGCIFGSNVDGYLQQLRQFVASLRIGPVLDVAPAATITEPGRPLPETPLYVGPDWYLSGLERDGTALPVATEIAAHIGFSANGRFAMSDGANSYVGFYQATGQDRLRATATGSTFKLVTGDPNLTTVVAVMRALLVSVDQPGALTVTPRGLTAKVRNYTLQFRPVDHPTAPDLTRLSPSPRASGSRVTKSTRMSAQPG